MKGVTAVKCLTSAEKIISTHTPVKGVTKYCAKRGTSSDISTHTPVKGVTSPNGNAYVV